MDRLIYLPYNPIVSPSDKTIAPACAQTSRTLIPKPPSGISYRQDASGWTIGFPGWNKRAAMVAGAVVAGGRTAFFSYLFFRDGPTTPTGERILYFLFIPVLWLLGLGLASGLATWPEYRVADGTLTVATFGLFRNVVQSWQQHEILQIVGDSNCVTLLHVRDGKWMRAKLSVREDTNRGSRGPDRQAEQRSRWLANALQQTLQIQSLPDHYQAVQATTGGPQELFYGVTGTDQPAVRILKNGPVELSMEVEHCGIVKRNVPAFLTACATTACALLTLTLLGDRPAGLIRGLILGCWLATAACGAYVLWRSRSSTILRAANRTLKIYQRSPLGVILNVTLKANEVEEIFVLGPDRIAARDARGNDNTLLTETDPATQDAIISFINDALWPERADEKKAPVARATHTVLEDWSFPPLTFRAHRESWELLQKRGAWDQISFIAIIALPAIALSWAWLHFHPWGMRSSVFGVSTLWVILALLLQGPVCGLVLPKRIVFDGTGLTYTHPTYLGVQKLQWQAWQIGGLHVNHNHRGRPSGGIRLTTRDGRNKIVLMANPEEPIRRVAETIAQSVGLEARR